ncbi:hypothetical protein B0H14DRAFT_2604101 [Mycena olivaceomarginata]|nr:hypothetical protein B0H14DRAFT_2604101 [Mycena olivaceomarginata]
MSSSIMSLLSVTITWSIITTQLTGLSGANNQMRQAGPVRLHRCGRQVGENGLRADDLSDMIARDSSRGHCSRNRKNGSTSPTDPMDSCRTTSGIPGDEAVVKLEVLQLRESQQGVPHSRIERQPLNIQSLEVSVKIECRATSPMTSVLYCIKEPNVPDLWQTRSIQLSWLIPETSSSRSKVWYWRSNGKEIDQNKWQTREIRCNWQAAHNTQHAAQTSTGTMSRLNMGKGYFVPMTYYMIHQLPSIYSDSIRGLKRPVVGWFNGSHQTTIWSKSNTSQQLSGIEKDEDVNAR